MKEFFFTFFEHYQKNRIPGKVLLIVDGHTFHSALPALEFCQQHEIEILCLPPHTTHMLQQLDRSVFKSKANYHDGYIRIPDFLFLSLFLIHKGVKSHCIN